MSFKTLTVLIEPSNASQTDEVIFLYQIKDGMARESHGYYIAEKAGVSDKIVARARDVAKSLRENLPVLTAEHQRNSPLGQYCQVR